MSGLGLNDSIVMQKSYLIILIKWNLRFYFRTKQSKHGFKTHESIRTFKMCVPKSCKKAIHEFKTHEHPICTRI